MVKLPTVLRGVVVALLYRDKFRKIHFSGEKGEMYED